MSARPVFTFSLTGERLSSTKSNLYIMMANQVTSVEQSKRLLELGVPAENASMVWER